MFEGICEAIHRELDKLDSKYEKGTQMTDADLKDIDTMTHVLKSIAGYEMAKGNSEYDGGSYARGRSRMTGRYVSRDDGYSREESYRRY